MVDRSVDAVGYQASTEDGKKEAPSIVLENCIKVTRPTGGIGVPGLYVPSDPGAPDSNSSQGKLLISFGKLFEKVRFFPPLFLLFFQSNILLQLWQENKRKGRVANARNYIGTHNWHGPMQCQNVQPLPARHDYLWPC